LLKKNIQPTKSYIIKTNYLIEEVDNTIVWLRRYNSLLEEAIKQVLQQPRNSLHPCL
jgi:hypothetical protein